MTDEVCLCVDVQSPITAAVLDLPAPLGDAFNLFDLDKGTPLPEPVEVYDGEITAAVTRHVRVTAPTYFYTAADIAADGAAPDTTFTVKVTQISTLIDAAGRGVTAAAQL